MSDDLDIGEIDPVAEEATALLKALAHPLRLTICCKLREGEISVGDMESRFGFRQPRLSRELAKLREEGLVETRRESKVVFYRLADNPRARAMIDAVHDVMTGQERAPSPQSERMQRPNRPGGYGVFARARS